MTELQKALTGEAFDRRDAEVRQTLKELMLPFARQKKREGESSNGGFPFCICKGANNECN